MTKRTRHHAGRDQNERSERERPGPGQALIGFQEPESSLFGVPLPTSSLFGVPHPTDSLSGTPQPTTSLFGVPQQANRPAGANDAPAPPRPRSPQDDYRRQQAFLLANQRVVPVPTGRRSWPVLLGFPLAVLLLGIALGVIIVVMLLAAGVPAPWAHSPAHARSTSALPQPNAPAPADPTSVDPAPRPATWISKTGTYLVGTQLRAGRYTTDGGVSCYWARLRDVDGAQKIVAEGNGDGRTTVLIRKADSAFRTSGCTVWTRR